MYYILVLQGSGLIGSLSVVGTKASCVHSLLVRVKRFTNARMKGAKITGCWYTDNCEEGAACHAS